MRTILQLLPLCSLGVATSQGEAEFGSSINNHPELYKAIKDPWFIKEAPTCYTVCPDEANYTWDYYFGYLIDIGVRTFALGGYAIRASRISVDFGYHASWNKTGFEVLRKQVDKVGGRILADLRGYGEESFDKAAFLESAAMFTKDFPVDGFQLLTEGFASIPFLKEVFKAIKELSLLSSLWFSSHEWPIVNDNGLGKIADTYLVTIGPSYFEEISTFNTDRFAEEAINNATRAGVDLNTLVMTITLLARANYPNSDIGYSDAIYDLGADPKGNGSVIFTEGRFYFFSQRRAVDKIELAKKHGLRGIGLLGSNALLADLYPWDERSLLYGLATNL